MEKIKSEKKVKKPLFKRPVVWIALVIILAIIASPKDNNATSGDTKPQGIASTSAGQTESQAEPQKIDVKALGDAFDANQVAAEKEWGGKHVEFAAEITNINEGRLSFSKGVSSKEYSMTQISCNLKDDNQALSVANEQTVTVRGVVGDQTIGVINLKDCTVVQ